MLRCVTNIKIQLRLRETLPVRKKAISNMTELCLPKISDAFAVAKGFSFGAEYACYEKALPIAQVRCKDISIQQTLD